MAGLYIRKELPVRRPWQPRVRGEVVVDIHLGDAHADTIRQSVAVLLLAVNTQSGAFAVVGDAAVDAGEPHASRVHRHTLG